MGSHVWKTPLGHCSDRGFVSVCLVVGLCLFMLCMTTQPALDGRVVVRSTVVEYPLRPIPGAQELTSPIITLVSTFRCSSDHEYTNRNTVRSWSRLRPWVLPVLFVADRDGEMTNSSSCAVYAARHGWLVMQYTRITHGMPVLKAMFEEVYKTGLNTTFVGYANGDVMFDVSLVTTLLRLTRYDVNISTRTILVSGRRTNIPVSILHHLKDASDVSNVAPLYKRFIPYRADAADYLITSRAGFNWSHVPEFIIGNTRYDSWMMCKAVQWQVLFIDVTNTVLAIHQTGQDGDFSSHHRPTSMNEINTRLLDNTGYNASIANLNAAPYETHLTSGCNNGSLPCIEIIHRR